MPATDSTLRDPEGSLSDIEDELDKHYGVSLGRLLLRFAETTGYIQYLGRPIQNKFGKLYFVSVDFLAKHDLFALPTILLPKTTKPQVQNIVVVFVLKYGDQICFTWHCIPTRLSVSFGTILKCGKAPWTLSCWWRRRI